jgi:5-methylcytosine-specific restriction endonuclease McrA
MGSNLSSTARHAKKRTLRAALGELCFYCGDPMDFTKYNKRYQQPKLATLEHIEERSSGGVNANVNLVLACRGCNLMVRGWSVEEKHNYAEYKAKQRQGKAP